MFFPSDMQTSSGHPNGTTAPVETYFLQVLYSRGNDWAFIFMVPYQVPINFGA